jgi:hypothetical protein
VDDDQALAGLVGTWSGHGHGDYPTIEPFDYHETVELRAVPGKPFLAYAQRTRDAVDDRPLHAEVGYLRPAGEGTAELVIAQPTGIADVYSGSWDGAVLDLRATSIARTPTAKDVHALRRRFVLDGDRLSYDLWMAHADTPETHHLHAELERQR